MTKKIYPFVLAFLGLITLAGIAVAAFGDKGQILGSSFSMGSSDIKFLKNLSGGIVEENLTDELPGPQFSNIGPNWSRDYPMKIYNNSNNQLTLTSNSNYLTVNDPDDLRSIIFVEPFEWNDINNNGIVDSNELGQSLGKKSITKWKTEGYNFLTINAGTIRNYVLRFSTDAVSDTKQGKSAVFDFIFDAITVQ